MHAPVASAVRRFRLDSGSGRGGSSADRSVLLNLPKREISRARTVETGGFRRRGRRVRRCDPLQLSLGAFPLALEISDLCPRGVKRSLHVLNFGAKTCLHMTTGQQVWYRNGHNYRTHDIELCKLADLLLAGELFRDLLRWVIISRLLCERGHALSFALVLEL